MIYSMSKIVQKEQRQPQVTYKCMYFKKTLKIRFYSIYNIQCIIKTGDDTAADT